MYNNQSLDERAVGSVCNEGYDFHNELTGNRYFMKWSPQEDTKFYSRSRYGSPRMLSKSVPRKNKNLARCRINRSLNFDAGIPTTDLKFKSPNSSSDSICCDEDKQLTRSAKIMRALNLSSSPLSIEKKKVNKSLNFDISPNPKRLINYNRSPCNIVHLNLSTSSPKISKTLNFDFSPAESNISSILGTSFDSIDENQNQTPSQRRRSVKKSLKYLTPQRKTSISSDFDGKSPMLRTELKEKIDNMIQVTTPNMQSLKKSIRKLSFVKDVCVRTPRNLFNDFEDEDCEGSQTPKNKIRLVPESMSAIKKSHKKERSRRLDVEVVTNEILENEQFTEKPKKVTERSSTPPVQEDLQNSNFDVSSIKRSHKKDRSKRKLPLCHSEDELSETGSIFDYSGIKDISSSCEGVSDYFELERSKDTKNRESAAELLEDKVISSPAKLKCDSDPNLCKLNNSVKVPATPKSEKVNVAICITSPTTPPNETGTLDKTPVSPTNKGPETSIRPSTPKNHINFLQRVIGSSIKKSHKKVKDENKKRLLKPKTLQSSLDDSDSKQSEIQDCENLNKNQEPEASCSNVSRATTPENINSSRLLLPQFSSVKKSHKKDKHSKILSSFARRQKIFSYDKERLSSSDCTSKNCSPLGTNLKSHSIQTDNVEEPNKSIEEVSGVKNQVLSHLSESSPKKRKISSSSDLDDVCTPLSMDDSVSIDYITAEEEFKIFTPIKKRRAALARRLSGHEFEVIPVDKFEDVPLTRCITPVLDQSRAEDSTQDNFVTPERSINASNVPDEPKGKSTPKTKSTPKNRSTVELMLNINSIKRSHRKDKKGSRLPFKNESARLDFETVTPIGEINSPLINASNFLTPESSLLSNKASENSFRNVSLMASKFLQSYECDNSKPSTSYESRGDDEGDEKKTCIQLTATPPNLLKTKSYLRIMQNESIKRSHKKKREELRQSMLAQDPEMSDDGSIFSEENRVEDFPVDCAIDRKNADKNLGTSDRVSVVANMNESLFEDNVKSRISRLPNPYSRIGISSDDGSLFDSVEELEERYNDFNEMDKFDETQSIN